MNAKGTDRNHLRMSFGANKGESDYLTPSQKENVIIKLMIKNGLWYPDDLHDMEEEGKNIGRPSVYTLEVADKICEELATTNKSLRKICEGENMPSVRTVLYWLSEGSKDDGKQEFKDFLHQYTRAREAQADVLADEIIEIAEHTEEDHTAFTGINVIQRDKLRIEARKWVAAKLKPKKYGDKIDHNHEGQQTIIVKYQDEE